VGAGVGWALLLQRWLVFGEALSIQTYLQGYAGSWVITFICTVGLMSLAFNVIFPVFSFKFAVPVGQPK